MTSYNMAGIPAAPYPPMIPPTNIERSSSSSTSASTSRNRSRSFSSANKTINSPQPSHDPSAKRQLPARVEFYTSDIYGAVNCGEHIPASSSYTTSTYHGHGHGMPSSFRSGAIHTPMSGGAKKLGPVLLELRSVLPHAVDANSHGHGNGHQGKTFALTRGTAGSTCLSFKNHYDINGNVIRDICGDTIHAATGLVTGVLCINTVRNVRDHIPPSSEEQDVKQWEVLDSAKSNDASVLYFSHHNPKNPRHASSVAWRPGGSYSRYVAIGLVGASSAERGATSSTPPPSANKDRDYCALVWDIEASSKGVKQGK